VETGWNVGMDEGNCEADAKNNNKIEKEPVLIAKDSYSNSYKLHKIDFEDIWEFQFLITAVPTLISLFRFMKNFRKYLTEEIINKFDDFFDNCIKTLKTLEDFLTNKLVAYISYSQEYGSLSFNRQNLLREQCILGLLCLFLYKIFPIQEDDSESNIGNIDNIGEEAMFFNQKLKDFNVNFFKKEEKRKLIKEMEEVYQKKRSILGNRIYKLLMLASNGHPSNQEYLFRFLNIFEKHLGLNYPITQALEMILGQNDKILYELHKKKLQASKIPEEAFLFNDSLIMGDENFFLNELIKKMQNPNDSNLKSRSYLIRLLIKFCYLADHSIFINQEKIFKAMLEGKCFSNYSLFKLCSSSEGNDLLLEMKGKDGIIQAFSLEEFLKNSDFYGGTSKLLKNQLELYSKLCLSRNYNCCRFFAEIFPLNLLVKYLLTNDLDVEIRAIMCSLISNIYLDKEPRIMIIRPNLIRKIQIRVEEQKPKENIAKKLQNLMKKKSKKEKAVSFTV